jgi:hemolysin activation/secretion protein
MTVMGMATNVLLKHSDYTISEEAIRHNRIGSEEMRKLISRQCLLFSFTALFFIFIGVIFNPLISLPANAQEFIQMGPTDRPGDRRPPVVEEKKPLAPPPELTFPKAAVPKEKKLIELPLISMFVRNIVVTGSTVFTPEEFGQITRPYEKRVLTSEDLEQLRQELTRFYIEAGNVTSGAVIPDQTVADGVIRFHIIEGKLKNIDVEGNKWLRKVYIKKRIGLGTAPPLNIHTLQERLQVFQQNPRIQMLNAELKPGIALGESDLKVKVDEELPFRIWTGVDNYLSKSVGPEQIQVNLADLSLTGYGDILSFTWGYAEGLHPKIDLSYSFPFTAYDSTVYLRYRKNDFDVVREPFEELDIETDSDIYSIALSHPFYRSPSQEFVMSLGGDHAKQKTTLLDLPFSLEPGAEDGEIKVSALRFAQEYTYRSRTQVISARSQFSLGVDVLDATTRSSGLPDGQFFKWLGQFQWVKRFKPWDIQSILRTDFQFSADPLVSLEQFPIGGRYTVRGYPQNILVRDNAVIASLEFRIPVVRNKPWAEYLQLVPFFDFGWGENTDVPTPEPRNISSVGLGLKWATTLPLPFRLTPQFEIFWGKKLRKVEGDEGSNLVDEGIQFQISIAGL